MVDAIHVVSAERIAAEMRLMLVHRRRAAAVDLLRDVGLLGVILPELAMANEAGEVTAVGRAGDEAWLAALDTLDALPEAGFPLALAALLYPFVDGPGTAAVGRRWKLSNSESKRARWLVERHDALKNAQQLPWSRMQPLVVSDGILDLVALDEAIAAASGQPAGDAAWCRRMLELPRERLDPPPLVTGDDLIAHGVPRGKAFQRLLGAARDAQLDNQIATRAEALQLVDRLRSQGGSSE
jgi:poly(A) polymerase